MNEQRQNEACCKALRWQATVEATGIYRHDVSRSAPYPLVTRDDNMVRLLRAKVIEAGARNRFLCELGEVLGWEDEGGTALFSEYGAMELMQATPAQQVEAALRALGKWEGK